MTTLILGSKGQLGGDICDVWRGQDANIIEYERETLDVTDDQKLMSTLLDESFDVLINCTSFHNTDAVEDNPELALAVNANAIETMAQACKQKKAQFVHFSTDYVFGGGGPRAELITEDAERAPINVYGLSKTYGEILGIFAYSNTTIFRVASLFGTRGASSKGGNFVETMIRVGREAGLLKVVNDQIMSPTSTQTVAECVWKFLKNGTGQPGIYHCVNGGQASWFEFAKTIIERTGVDARVTPCSSQEYATRAKRPAFSALDNSKLSKIIGPIPDWHNALDAYLAAKGYASDV